LVFLGCRNGGAGHSNNANGDTKRNDAHSPSLSRAGNLSGFFAPS
jgi:hypothetical protein